MLWKKLKKRISEEPVLFQGLIQATFPALVAFELIDMSSAQLGIIYTFTAALLSFLTRKKVTPLANPKDAERNKLSSS